MRRLFLLALMVFGLVAAQTASSAGDAQGPPCSNITNGSRSYVGDVVDITVSLQAPACSSLVTYSFVVTDTSGTELQSTATPDSTDSTNPACTPDVAGEGCVHFSVNLGASGPDTVCIYATTAIHGHVADRAPNVSDPTCPASSPSISLARTVAGADGGFN